MLHDSRYHDWTRFFQAIGTRPFHYKDAAYHDNPYIVGWFLSQNQ